jgi:hypothetical protein
LVSNAITYDKDSQTEPTFVISSATEGGLDYSYNKDMSKSMLSDPVRDGRIVDHRVPIYVRLTNDGSTKGSISFQLIAKMRAVKSCLGVEPKSCINCVSQLGHQWNPKTNMCFDHVPKTMDSAFFTALKQCP